MKKLLVLFIIVNLTFLCCACSKKLDKVPKYPKTRGIAGWIWYGVHGSIPEVDNFYKKYPYFSDYIYNQNKIFEIRENISGEKGVFDKETGDELIPTIYKNLSFAPGKFDEFFITEENGIKKLLTFRNEEILVGDFDQIKCTECGIEVTKNNKKGIYSYLGHVLLPVKFDNIRCQLWEPQSMERYYLAKSKDKWYAFNYDGKPLFSPKKYPILSSNSFGPYFEIIKNGKRGIIDIYGNIIVKPQYDIVYQQRLDNKGIKHFTVCNLKNENEKSKTLSDKYLSYLINSSSSEYMFDYLSSKDYSVKPEYYENDDEEDDDEIEESEDSKEKEWEDFETIRWELDNFYKYCGVVGIDGKEELPVKFKGCAEKIADDYYSVHIDNTNKNYIADRTGQITSKKPCGHVYYSYDNTYVRCLMDRGKQDVFRLDGKPMPADSLDYNKIWAWNDDLVEFEVNHKRGVLYKDKILIEPNYAWVNKIGEYFYIVPNSDLKNGSRIIVPIKDLIESKDNINKAKEYPDYEYTYEKIDDNCFKFIKNDDKTEDVYCKKSN